MPAALWLEPDAFSSAEPSPSLSYELTGNSGKLPLDGASYASSDARGNAAGRLCRCGKFLLGRRKPPDGECKLLIV
jgi:hypothetical protein